VAAGHDHAAIVIDGEPAGAVERSAGGRAGKQVALDPEKPDGQQAFTKFNILMHSPVDGKNQIHLVE
jgi:hypothetical protein